LQLRRVRARRALAGIVCFVELDDLLLEPLLPWAIKVGILDLLVFHQRALLGIEQQHLVRAQPSAAHNVRGRDIHHAAFGREYEQV